MTECQENKYTRKAIDRAVVALVVSAILIIIIFFVIPMEIAYWNDTSATTSLTSDQLAYWHSTALSSLTTIAVMGSIFVGYRKFQKEKKKCIVCTPSPIV